MTRSARPAPLGHVEVPGQTAKCPRGWRRSLAERRHLRADSDGAAVEARPILVVVALPNLSDLRRRRTEILEVANARGATRVRVVGSVARGDATESSDVDFLVDLEPGRGLLDLGGLLMDLQDLLGHDVDVTTEAGLRPRVARRVLADAVEL